MPTGHAPDAERSPRYGREPSFGTFITPTNADPGRVVELAQLSEELGLDLVTFQDHPYQPAFLDTWTLMSYVAARTVQIGIAPNVANLPLRPPAVLARAAASLDLLSGGRFELGLGAGAFWDAIVAMGEQRRAPGEAVDALAEAIEVIRAIWDPATRGGVRLDGQHYRVAGAKRGPAPAHPIGIWLGAYGPRMLRLTGRTADGWLPSAGYLPPDKLPEAQAAIDAAAIKAGRDPSAIRRLYNVNGRFGARAAGFLDGPPDHWVDQLTALVTEAGMDTFILGSDDPAVIGTFASEVVPAVRLAVAELRAGRADEEGALRQAQGTFGVVPTADDGERLTTHRLWDESTRPAGPAPDPDRRYTPHELATGQHLIDVHDHLRAELAQIRELVAQVAVGGADPALVRNRINEMTIRQNNWTVGAYCAQYCRLVTTHHTIEDRSMFPALRAGDPRLADLIARLEQEHQVIHGTLEGVDRALVAFVEAGGHGPELIEAVDVLTDTLLSHLAYEERELVEPIARLGLG
ncbi:LLM class flavin-dependent oxidoreductase [Microlunatus ginsengisoli]|uniref:LLM class flavin-dependent oxidoreductase n=1 Tax=Microlunatus ginsengisoli TaxID=363863 RepID=A0ABP7AT60_9ACTN